MPNTTLHDKLLEIFRETLANKYIDIDSECDQNLNCMITLLRNNQMNIIDSKDLKLDYSEEYFMFCYDIDKELDTNNIKPELINSLSNSFNSQATNYTSFNFIFIVDKLCNKLLIEEVINKNGFKRDILNTLKNLTKNSNLKLSDIEYKAIFISSKEELNFELKIDSRIRSLEMPTPTQSSFKGYVFSASLFDIVEIYNSLGNELFDKNVRYGIDDELQVQYKIRETLENNPDKFWYLNNGITMIIKDKEFCLSKSNHLYLQYGDEKDLYVINGAQTISAAAEFFYASQPSSNLDVAKANAKVMFRIIEIDSTLNTNIDAEIDEVSISLNRQKPIKVEDIAFTTPFVYSLNKLNETSSDPDTSFRLIKRGEKILSNHEYNLVQFSRSVKAYLAQQPGKAMSQGSKTLLKIVSKNGLTAFSDESIFKQDIIIDENMRLEDFKKYYSPVNLALELEKCYSDFSRKTSFNVPIQQAALNYGKWHFVAYMIYVLNNNNFSDFTQLHIDLSNLSTSIENCITSYIKLFDAIVSSQYSSLTSNDFKNDTLYTFFRDYSSNSNADSSIVEQINSFSALVKSLLK